MIGKILNKGMRTGDVYLLPQLISAHFSTRFQMVDDRIWHARLGQPHMRLVRHLQNKGSIKVSNKQSSSSFICESCNMAKASQLPFVPITRRSKAFFELVHLDVWGPSPVLSKNGFRFYVCLMDDFTRYTWLIPLKAKSDFYAQYLLFEKFVLCQFNTAIQGIQCDGGGEFINTNFINHLSSNGIRLNVSCPSTLQQNGVAKRKHRHIRELGLTMLFASKVPLVYWPEAFHTAVFLINRLPSSVRKFNSPFYLLHHQSPDYSSLRVFGT